jgi:hypothetical protein
MELFRIARICHWQPAVTACAPVAFSRCRTEKQLWPKDGGMSVAPPAYVKQVIAESALSEGNNLQGPEWEIAVQIQRVRKIGSFTLKSGWKNVEIIESSYTNASL